MNDPETPTAPPHLAELEARDDALIARVDTRMREAAASFGDRWRCGPGRADCCIGPFPIDALDAHRLRRGLAELEREEPERAEAVRRRAAEAVEMLREDFPGDPDSGLLGDDVDDLLDACEWHEELPCPALDRNSGLCELYRWRPLVCRTFGPPLRVRDETWEACPYCFARPGCADETPDRVELDEDEAIGALCAELEAATGRRGETFIAYALWSGDGRGGGGGEGRGGGESESR